MDHRFIFERNPPVMEPLPARRIPMFQVRVQCAGGIEHDVQAACETPIFWISKDRLARIKAGDAEPWIYTADQSHLFACVPLYEHPAPSTHTQALTDRQAASLAAMVTEYVEGGIRGGTDWRNGLENIIAARLRRLSKINKEASDEQQRA